MSDAIRSASDAQALSTEHLSFSYPGAEALVLRDVSFELEPGSFALLVGDTGSGKSTLLSLVKPEIAPTGERAGVIRVFGCSVEDMAPADSARTIGFVFQNPDNQIVCESVWHEISFGLENLGTPQSEMRRRVAETSYFFGMEDWFRSETDVLSGGRKQLLALASTLVMRPRLLLLDEPTAQLDPIAEKNFLHALFRVNRELGCTVVVATHAPQAMIDYATCAYRLADGCVGAIDLADFASSSHGAMDDFESMNGDVWSQSSVSTYSQVDGTAENQLMNDSRISSKNAKKTVHGVQNSQRATAAAVELSSAWFRYDRDGDWVLRGLDLRIETGEIHALVGGNGCGKSTLLALMAGVRKVQRGKLRVRAASRALLPQDPHALFAAETVEAELMEWSHGGTYDRADALAMLARMGLDGRASLHPYDLSGGQQQLLALGKLLLVRPQLLLLDEPTKGLDGRARRLVAEILCDLRTEGVTVVMATHDLAFARDVADCVSMVFDGEVACTEPAVDFFRNNLYYRP